MYVNSLKEITVTQLLTYYIGIQAICLVRLLIWTLLCTVSVDSGPYYTLKIGFDSFNEMMSHRYCEL